MSKKSDTTDFAKAPDAFLSTSARILQWIEDNAPVVALVVAVGSVVGLSYVGYSYWNSHKESTAAEQLYRFEADLKKAETRVREERAKKMQELAGLSLKSKAQANPDLVRPVDFTKDYAGLVNKLKEELKAVEGTRAAVVSALNLSYFLVQQKQFEEALAVLKIPSHKPSSGDLVGGFWRMHYGLVLIENNQPDQALSLYDEVLSASKLKPFHPEAMLKQGIAYELKGDSLKAKETYEKLGRDFPNTEASASATQFLRLLELKSKQG